MGILYNSVKAHQELKRNFVLEKLLAAGVKVSHDGIDIHELSYDDLKYEYVLLSFRQIDTGTDSSKWF